MNQNFFIGRCLPKCVFFYKNPSPVDKASGMGAQGMDWCRGVAEPKPNYPVLTCPKADPSWLRRKDSASQLSTCEEFSKELGVEKRAHQKGASFCFFLFDI